MPLSSRWWRAQRESGGGSRWVGGRWRAVTGVRVRNAPLRGAAVARHAYETPRHVWRRRRRQTPPATVGSLCAGGAAAGPPARGECAPVLQPAACCRVCRSQRVDHAGPPVAVQAARCWRRRARHRRLPAAPAPIQCTVNGGVGSSGTRGRGAYHAAPRLPSLCSVGKPAACGRSAPLPGVGVTAPMSWRGWALAGRSLQRQAGCGRPWIRRPRPPSVQAGRAAGMGIHAHERVRRPAGGVLAAEGGRGDSASLRTPPLP